jgi:hypothetical protein
MDLSAARAARGAGDYHRALRLYRCVPAYQRTLAERESYDCLLELTSCRRVIDDLMARLNWQRERYGGFGHLDRALVRHADTAGLCDAFVALRRVGGARALARASMAGELLGQRQPDDAAMDQLGDLGIRVRGGVRWEVAQAQMRVGQSAAALANLRAVVVEAPSQMLGWHALALMLLRRGQRSEAMVPAHFATQMPRNRPNVYADSGEPVLRYRGHAVFFSEGGFSAFRAPRRRAYRDPEPAESIDPGARPWSTRVRAFCRAVATARALQRLRGLLGPRVGIVARSEDLAELIVMLDDLAIERARRQAAWRPWPFFKRAPRPAVR